MIGFQCVFFQAEDGIRDLVRSRGLGDVYKRQVQRRAEFYFENNRLHELKRIAVRGSKDLLIRNLARWDCPCLLYTSDAADERSSVDLGGRRIIKKKHHNMRPASRHI